MEKSNLTIIPDFNTDKTYRSIKNEAISNIIKKKRVIINYIKTQPKSKKI